MDKEFNLEEVRHHLNEYLIYDRSNRKVYFKDIHVSDLVTIMGYCYKALTGFMDKEKYLDIVDTVNKVAQQYEINSLEHMYETGEFVKYDDGKI